MKVKAKPRKKKAPTRKSNGAAKADNRDPLDAVKRISEIQRLRFVEMDTALLNHTQEIKILDQAQRLEAVEYEGRKRTRQQRVNELREAIEVRTAEQRMMLAALGAEYDFDPTRTSIDDKTGVIQEMPESP